MLSDYVEHLHVLGLWRLNYVANIGLQKHAKCTVAEIVTMNIAVFIPYNRCFCQLVTELYMEIPSVVIELKLS